MTAGGTTNIKGKNIMLKNIATLFLILSPLFSYADNSVEAASSQALKQLILEQGLPLPGSGLVLKPMNQMPHYETMKDSIERDNASIKKYGYVKIDSPEIQSLLNFTRGNKNFSSKNLTASADTGLYKSIDDIQTAYRYYGIPATAMQKILAVGPAGTFLEGKGWTGAAQVFEKTGLGVCNYSEMNFKLSNGSIMVPLEFVTYAVNGKVTVKNIKGEDTKGFMYTVSWYDDSFYHQLECAQSNFSTETMPDVIKLASLIDTNSH